MKKIFLFTVILLQVGFLSAQERDNVGHRVGPWNLGAPQQGITWKIRRSYYSDNSENFINEIEIKNTNNSTVTFSYNISENANETATRHRKTLAPNETYTNKYCQNAQSVYFFVEPSNGQVTNQQTTQQNDPTFDRNNASFQDYYKRAMSAKDAGNYEQAESFLNSAISVAVNDAQRDNAKQWLTVVQNAKHSSVNNNNQTRTTPTYTPPQPNKAQKQAEALNQVSNSLMDLAKALDKAKAEKREKKRKEAAELLENQNEIEQKNKQIAFEKSSLSLIQYIGPVNDYGKFKNYVSNLGYKYMYHEGINNLNQEVFEGFYIDRCCGDHVNFIFNKGEEKSMISLLQQLVEVKDYITFYVDNNSIKNNGFALTNTKGHTTEGHGTGIEEDYNYILKVASKFSETAGTESNSQQQTNTSGDYAAVSKAALIEAGKDTDEGYKTATVLLEPYANSMSGDDLNTLGFWFWKVKDYLRAVKYYKMSGDEGNDWGNNNLGNCYQNGWGVDTNYVKAFEYYNKVSSSFEYIGAIYHQLGHLCADGANNAAGKSDYTSASSYYTMGANANNSNCMLHLGEFYDTGGKLTTNLALAKYWYKKACDLKEEKACTKLKALE